MPGQCPNGHESEATDYCDRCGVAVESRPDEHAEEASACPNCGSPTSPGTACVRPAGSCLARATRWRRWVSQQWEVVVRPDRTYFDMLEPDGMEFPADPYSGRIALTGDHVSIGRYSKGKDITPDIDLSRDLEDTGVSHRHAVLMRQPSGSWALVDQDSTNGTFLNADEDPLPPNQPVALSHGDQIHVGGLDDAHPRAPGPGADTGHGDQDSRPSKDTRNIAHGRRRVEIDLLGPLRLRVKGEEVPITAHLERAVLAYLALNVGTSVSVGNLEAALWGDREPANSNKALQDVHRQPAQALCPRETHRDGPVGLLPPGRRGTPWTRFVSSAGVPGAGRSWRSGHPGASVALLTERARLVAR